MTIRDLPLERIEPSPWNKRTIRTDEPAFAEFAESIRERGLIQPIVVRTKGAPKKGKPRDYEVIAGHRRLAAVRLIERETIPAIIRTGVSDEEAVKDIVTENLQREDLTPLEEGEQVKVMVDAGWDVDAVAKQIGRTRAWVYTRAKIADLSPKWKDAIDKAAKEEARDDADDAVLEGKPNTKTWDYNREHEYGLHKWGVALLEEVARVPHGIQDTVLKDYVHRPTIPTARILRHNINRYSRELSRAAFDFEATDLVDHHGACVTCPERRGVQPDLFGFDGPIAPKNDVCLNADCFADKVKAHQEQTLAFVRVDDPDAVELHVNDWGVFVDKETGRIPTDYEAAGEGPSRRYFVKCSEKDPDAVQGVVTGKQGDGSIQTVKLVHEETDDNRKTIKRLRAELAEDRDKAARDLARKRIGKITWDEAKAFGFDAVALLRLKAAKASSTYWRTSEHTGAKLKDAKGGADDEFLAGVWEDLRGDLIDRHYEPIPSVKYLAIHFGLDWKEIRQGAREKHPTPPEWRGLSDDDVPPDPAPDAPRPELVHVDENEGDAEDQANGEMANGKD